MGPGPIPRSAIVAYAEDFGIVGDRQDLFVAIIRTVDSEYLALVNSRETTRTEKGSSAQAGDVDAVKGVFQRLGARAGEAKGKRKRNGNLS